MAALLNLNLRALKYPQVPVDLADADQLRKLVIWLENLKIREYKIVDRKGLADTASPGWDAAFAKYLKDLDCPVPPGDQRAAVEWLVGFAVNLDYEDNADKMKAPEAAGKANPASAGASSSAASTSATSQPGKSSKADEGAFSDLDDPQVAAAVLQLIRAAQVPWCGGGEGGDQADVVSAMQAAAERLACQVGPAQRPGVWRPEGPAAQCLAEVPLGFEVQGEALSSAAKVLRLLYIRDLRRLQSQIDHAVVDMQEYTANPKTDSSLGKVGR
ncbi:hypothetical protein CHLRE_16g679164v5 [Chlamydomonas reinhardtii]|uniref:Uncharacterized protein n=1 Tax=Chlamydomonas reinhardtii TaxID=3055 RepID=A8JBC2_CHLRE|nr:uncharacterized protein CHLRE_16g679164v5 [Chlamydomonas reinhardtii]PNW71772.1 hypothetical protein CHLRE_16g679164v5 [Chlamydomonas reinhardtii]|eukprot:XP_001699270.1 predicted protein [Chlamydomonas reinhardtii]